VADVVPRRVPAAIVGDDLIELSLKPSPWFILLYRGRWLAGLFAAVVVLEAVAQLVPGVPNSVVMMKLACLAALLFRAGLTTLQWASRSYLLTNRRIMRIRGVLQADVAQCLLARVAGVEMSQNALQTLLGIGTIRITPASDAARTITWRHVSKPAETLRTIHAAIARSRGRQIPCGVN
jgi:uncharacterized membrane protein YdbT with pleckstrin-like domain